MSRRLRLLAGTAAAALAAVAALATAAAAAAPVTAPDAARARLQYLQYCSGCHLADGSGSPVYGIPVMRGMLGRFLHVSGGREYIVQVPGVMNSPLSDADIANLMNWLLPTVSAATLPAEVAPYTAAEIARLRLDRPLDVMARRAALVERMGDGGAAAPR